MSKNPSYLTSHWPQCQQHVLHSQQRHPPVASQKDDSRQPALVIEEVYRITRVSQNFVLGPVQLATGTSYSCSCPSPIWSCLILVIFPFCVLSFFFSPIFSVSDWVNLELIKCLPTLHYQITTYINNEPLRRNASTVFHQQFEYVRSQAHCGFISSCVFPFPDEFIVLFHMESPAWLTTPALFPDVFSFTGTPSIDYS